VCVCVYVCVLCVVCVYSCVHGMCVCRAQNRKMTLKYLVARQ
jgi:hypothetical protein